MKILPDSKNSTTVRLEPHGGTVAADMGGTMNTPLHPLLTWFGRTPSHYELYLLPAGVKAGVDHTRIGITGENGKVYIFEFDFMPPGMAVGLAANLSRCAMVEHYRTLHRNRYGNICISQ